MSQEQFLWPTSLEKGFPLVSTYFLSIIILVLFGPRDLFVNIKLWLKPSPARSGDNQSQPVENMIYSLPLFHRLTWNWWERKRAVPLSRKMRGFHFCPHKRFSFVSTRWFFSHSFSGSRGLVVTNSDFGNSVGVALLQQFLSLLSCTKHLKV